jgi:hypothetical protein
MTSVEGLLMEAVRDGALECQEYYESVVDAEAFTDRLKTLLACRFDAIERRDLAAALRLDSDLEDCGMDPEYRITCHSCRSWADPDHAHNSLTGERIVTTEFRNRLSRWDV